MDAPKPANSKNKFNCPVLQSRGVESLERRVPNSENVVVILSVYLTIAALAELSARPAALVKTPWGKYARKEARHREISL